MNIYILSLNLFSTKHEFTKIWNDLLLVLNMEDITEDEASVPTTPGTLIGNTFIMRSQRYVLLC